MKTRTLRGILAPGQSKRIIVDDGRFTQGMRIQSFRVWSPTWSNSGSAILSYSSTVPPNADASDGNQIAWTAFDESTTNIANLLAIIDPDHVVQEDLYVHSQGGLLSYLIEMVPITMTDSQGLLQLIKASRQDEP